MMMQLGPGMYSQSSAKCDECDATGIKFKEEDRCKVCKGERIKKVEK